jgi:hypothetical protein
MYLDKGKPVFHYTFANVAHYQIAASQALTPRNHTVVFDFKYDGEGLGKGGMGTLLVDGMQVAQGRIEHTVAARFTMSVETLDIGEDTGTPVTLSYDVPYRFTGTIDSVTIDLKPKDKRTEELGPDLKQRAMLERIMRE